MYVRRLPLATLLMEKGDANWAIESGPQNGAIFMTRREKMASDTDVDRRITVSLTGFTASKILRVYVRRLPLATLLMEKSDANWTIGSGPQNEAIFMTSNTHVDRSITVTLAGFYSQLYADQVRVS